MKIIVCVKQVPDSAATVAVEDGKVTWGDAPLVINPWDEYAVEAALALTEEHGGDVIALSLGNEDAKEALNDKFESCTKQIPQFLQDPLKNLYQTMRNCLIDFAAKYCGKDKKNLEAFFSKPKPIKAIIPYKPPATK